MLTLRELKDDDITLLSNWLDKERIIKYYKDKDAWLNEINKRNKEYNFIKHFIVEIDNKAIGFVQYYDYKLGKETWHKNINIDKTYSIDYLIGDDNYLAKGLAKEIIKELSNKIFNDTDCLKIIVQPDVDNIKSRRALLSSGYQYAKDNDLFILIKNM